MTMTPKTVVNNEIEQLFEIGAHFGYASARRHPSVKPYILGTKNKVEIFDLEKTIDLFDSAKQAMKKFGSEGKTVLFVGSKGEARDIIKTSAESIDMPFVAGRWIGGTITNFVEIRKRVQKLIDLTLQKEKGLLTKYTKKERLMIDRDVEKLSQMFEGLLSMNKLPDAVVVVDSKQEKITVDEAQQKSITTFAIAGSDCDISSITYPITANDSARKSIEFFIKGLVSAYEEGKKAPVVAKAPVVPEKK